MIRLFGCAGWSKVLFLQETTLNFERKEFDIWKEVLKETECT